MIGQEIEFNRNIDDRGMLMVVNHLPFEAKRMFFISDVPEGAVRGNHFSKSSGFLYVIIKGKCTVELDNGFSKEIYNLTVGQGLFFSKNTWMRIYDFQKDTILGILSDNEYRSSDYVSDYEEFKRIVREGDV